MDQLKSGTYPSNETNKEEEPLPSIEHCQKFEWVGRLVHGRLEGGKSSRRILAN